MMQFWRTDRMGHFSITYAIYHEMWKYGTDERLLKIGGKNIAPKDYEPHMYGHIYCPKCFTPLSRSPADKNLTKNTRHAHYKHLPSYQHIPCLYHTISQEGYNYVNEELTSETEENPQLKKVKGWAEIPPEKGMTSVTHINYTGINHDPEGKKTEVAIPRHRGDTVKLGSNIETVQYICWHLDELINVGFSLPSKSVSLPLKDFLYNSKLIKRDIGEEAQLFYGKMIGFHKQTFKNRTKIQCYKHHILYLYTNDEWDERRKFGESEIGKFVMFFGSIQWGEDKKPYIMLEDWGTYAVIPPKHLGIIKSITSEF